MTIMDYIIIGAAVLFALIGIWKGGAKLFFGLFMLIIIMVGSAFLSSMIAPKILTKETDAGVEFTSPATVLMPPLGGLLPTDGDFGAILNETVHEDENGNLYIVDTDHTIDSVFSAGMPEIWTYVGPIVKSAIIPGITLRESLAYTMTRYIYEIGIWVILVIILAIIRNIIRKKIFLWLDMKEHSTMSKIDRLVGLALNLAILLALFWGSGALVARFDNGANWAHTANSFMTTGTVAEPFMTNNPILKLIDAPASAEEAPEASE